MWVGHSCPTPGSLVLVFAVSKKSNASDKSVRPTQVSDPHTALRGLQLVC